MKSLGRSTGSNDEERSGWDGRLGERLRERFGGGLEEQLREWMGEWLTGRL